MNLKRMCTILWIAGALAGCGRLSASETTSVPPPAPAGEDEQPAYPPTSDTVTASGQVIPVVECHPGFARGGRVAAIAVSEGAGVRQGDRLVTLEAHELEAGVARAEAALASARAELALLKAGPRPGEAEAAKASVEAAEGSLARAMANQDRSRAGAWQAEREDAEARLAAAETAWMTARIDHDQLRDRDDVEDWQMEEAALQLRAAELDRAAAEAALTQVAAGAAVERRAAEGAVDEAEARRDAGQAQLALLQAAPRSEEVGTAEAAVAQAEAALETARISLHQLTLRAPCEGTVTALEISPGETVQAGQSVLTLADLRTLEVETTDLSEQDVGHVELGQMVTIHVEALQVDIRGHVVDIAPEADLLGGDVVYAVTIELDEQPAGLRWGMSVDVEIRVGER